MTAEVVIYNKSAIALAADSAVSIEGSNSNKIYNNAEKLFALTKHHPVGLMIYGCNELTGVPWELIIKQHRKALDNTSFDTLQEYAISFFQFAQDFYNSLPEYQKLKFFNDSIYNIATKTWDSIIELLDIDYLILEDTEELKSFLQAIKVLIEQYSKVEFFNPFNESDIQKICDQITFIATDVFNNYFGDEENTLFTEIYTYYLKLCAMKVIKEDPFFKDISGLVFAGYGEKEFFPQIVEYEIHGVINNNIKCRDISTDDNVKYSDSGLQAFAQRDEVDAFMQGSCRAIRDKFFSSTEQIAIEAESIINEALDELCLDLNKKAELQEKLINKLIEKYNKIEKELHLYTKKEHIDKVVQMIKHLPKNELAYMAESLVNLTAFKRKVSNDSDSVGGPIDVAVISKGDGFVWIKRKYYFPNDLNSNYGPK